MPYYHVGIIVDLDTDRTLDWQGLVEWPDGSNRCLFQAAIEVFFIRNGG
jgi:hypothetical protein